MPTIEDRLAPARPAARTSATLMSAIVAASLVAHGLLVAIAFVTARQLTPPPEEIPVEVVQDTPKPDKVPEAKPLPPKPPAKPEPPPEPPKAEPPPQPEPAKPEAPKPESPKPEAAKVAPPPAKSEPPKPAPDPDAARLAELQHELAALREQKAALAAQAATAPAPQGAPAGPQGPLAGSQLALALPGIGAGDGELVGYQDLVFSQLAKAKGDAEYRGKRKGTTGVTFDIDDTGALVDVTISVPSGDASLDAQALAIVRKAAPFPPPPKGGEHHFAANVNFIPPSP